GFEFYLNHKVTAVDHKGEEVEVKAENNKGEEISLSGDYVLVSIGRKPYTEGLNAEAAGVEINSRGQVEVNEHLQTNVDNIYAIGEIGRASCRDREETSIVY